jgi:hypothetical protein
LDADAYEKISRVFVEGNPAGGLARDQILDNITLYWLTNSATSAARMYSERGREAGRRRPNGACGFTPGRLHRLPRRDLPRPRSWVEKLHPNLTYFNVVDRGGHFAA